MAGFFSAAILDQVRAANDIVDVIGAAIPLKRAGTNFLALCPFHKEKTPSFNVNPQRQIYHCFGCHKGGNVFRFLQDYESITFPEAVQRLADRAKIPLRLEKEAEPSQSRFLKDSLLDLHERITQRWQAALTNEAAGEVARMYLAERGVSQEAIKLFRLGYAPDLWDDTVNWAKAKTIELPLLEKAGLIIRKPEGSHYYDRFRGRLMFPICDEQGRVIAFSGRALKTDDKTAKYINSPETPIFSKSRVFYGLDQAKRAILEAQVAIICEGQLDLIACHMAGVRNVVAPQGTAFTADHARILKRYADEVVLCFDSDAAGQKAAVRVLDSLLASGLAIRVATIPTPHDPDSFIRESGSEAFQELIARAAGFFDFYLDQLCAAHDASTDKGQLAISRAMAEALQKAGSEVLLDKYAQKTALRLGVSFEAARRQFKRTSSASARQAPASPDETGSSQPAIAKPSPQEFWLLKLLLLHDESVQWPATHLDLTWIQHPGIREVVSLRIEAHTQQTWTGPAALLTAISDDSLHSLVSEVLAEERPVPNPEQQLKDLLLRLRNQSLDREVGLLVRRAGSPETSDPDRLELLREVERLRALKLQPLQPRNG
jgi:DNA primase